MRDHVAEILCGAFLGMVAIHGDKVEIRLRMLSEKFRKSLMTIARNQSHRPLMTNAPELLANEVGPGI